MAADWMLLEGDCVDHLREMPDASVDAVVTDPPAGIGFMGSEWDSHGAREHFVLWLRSILIECLRVLKPGAHAVVWSLPRTSHWTALALEDAGFEIRDGITHLRSRSAEVAAFWESLSELQRELLALAEPTDSWVEHVFGQGFPKSRTALKPAAEIWWVARRPIELATVAEQVLATGTGGINIDGARVPWMGKGDREAALPGSMPNARASIFAMRDRRTEEPSHLRDAGPPISCCRTRQIAFRGVYVRANPKRAPQRMSCSMIALPTAP